MESSLLVFLTVSLVSVYSQENVTVPTLKGQVIGLRLDSNLAGGAPYDAFIGIPYAQKPVRFQLPVPPLPWTEPLVTQQDGPACPQDGRAFDEDCLFLNVFSPANASMDSSNLPVMAYIHGSAFTRSSSNSKFYGPDFLVSANVILVTMNYRLGAAGFLTLGSPEAPGNLGLHDTLLALQWIQDEISAFGGDPRQVTLFGQSAGSVMTLYHYLSPLSTGMFRSAIAQSGSPMSKWGLVPMEEAVRRARLLAEAVGCGSTPQNHSATVACLQAVDISYIVGNQSVTLYTDDMVSGSFMRFVPVIDTHLTSSTPFFNDSLENLMPSALRRAKPLMTGITTDEGTLPFILDDWKQAEGNLGAFTKQSGEVRTALAANIRDRYFPVTADQNKVQQLVGLYTDYMFAYPAIQVARYFQNLTYGYIFGYYGSWVLPVPNFSHYGMRAVGHGGELPYLFYVTGSLQTLDTCAANENDLNVNMRMVKWWTDFARTNGVPDASWPKVSEGVYRFIRATDSWMNSSVFEARCYNLWAAVDQASSQSATLSNHATLLIISIAMCVLLYWS